MSKMPVLLVQLGHDGVVVTDEIVSGSTGDLLQLALTRLRHPPLITNMCNHVDEQEKEQLFVVIFSGFIRVRFRVVW
jgi:hypothetical protein